MKEVKHTPGPWEAGEHVHETHTAYKAADFYKLIYYYSGPIRMHLADVYGYDKSELQANAHLIASAPETAAERDKLKEEVEHSNKLISSYQLEVSQRKEENARLKKLKDGLHNQNQEYRVRLSDELTETFNLQSINRKLVKAVTALIDANKRMAQWIVNQPNGNDAYTGMDAHAIGLQALKNSTL